MRIHKYTYILLLLLIFSTAAHAQKNWYKAIYKQTYFPETKDIDTAAYLSDLQKFLPDSIGEKGYQSTANSVQIIYQSKDSSQNSKKAKDYKNFIERYAPLTLSSIYSIYYVSPDYNYYAKAYFANRENTIQSGNTPRLHGPIINRSEFGHSPSKDISLTNYKNQTMAFHLQSAEKEGKRLATCVSLPDSSVYSVKKLSENQQVGHYSCTLYLVKNKKGNEMKIWVSDQLPWYVNNGMFIPQLHQGIVAVQTELKGKPVAYILVALEPLKKTITIPQIGCTYWHENK